MTSLIQYERCRAALAEATRIEDILPLRDQMDHLKLYAKQIQDKALLADTTEIQIRAEKKLGVLLIEAEKAGLLRPGRPKKPDPKNPTNLEGFTLKEIGVSHRLSADSQHKASISEQALESMIEGVRNRILCGRVKIIQEEDPVAVKKERRASREKILAGMQWALPDRKFGVILADPEWRFEPYSRDTGMDRAADNHYSTTATDVIAQRPVIDIAADDCCLFLWATVPMLPDALQVMSAWGFTYKSHIVWHKTNQDGTPFLGTGYWFRNAHELLLVGTRGNIPAPAMGTQEPSLLESPIGRHSAKPELFLQMIEDYFPSLPKIELNRRGPARKGWVAWGNEAQPGEFDHTGEIIDAEIPATNTDGASSDDPGVVGEVVSGGEIEAQNTVWEAADVERSPLVFGSDVSDRHHAGAFVAQISEDDPLLDIPEFLRRPREQPNAEAKV